MLDENDSTQGWIEIVNASVEMAQIPARMIAFAGRVADYAAISPPP